MKRALTLTLTLALVGGMLFMGFAGTAAADTHIDNNADVYQDTDAQTTQNQDQKQSNYAEQGNNYAFSTDGDATASNEANQLNLGVQYQDADTDATSDADVDQTIEDAIAASL